MLLSVSVTCALVAAAAGGYVYGHYTSTTANNAAGPASAHSTPPGDARQYQLTAPRSVLGGAFVYDPTLTSTLPASAADDFAAFGITNPTPVRISYKSSSSASRQTVQLTGAWGTIGDPEQVIDRHFAKTAQNAAEGPNGYTKLVGTLQTMHPTGLGDAMMKCQNVRTEVNHHNITTPICVWADHYTYGEVVVFDPGALQNGGMGVSLGENADTAARIRNDARVPR
ncbi:hypothetical protein [Streptomyces sp. NPDC059991]|uniref:hypothetical protein n=1 Tax=unclassified Streptomyces TaxID=2593676 RepID=UPI0036843CFC